MLRSAVIRQYSRDQEALAGDLRRAIRGEVTTDVHAMAEVRRDFGGMVHGTPAVVVRPQDAFDVSRVVAYAIRRSLVVSIRAAGHSQGGQSLSDGGVLLDMRSLDGVECLDVRDQSLEAGAGTLWLDAVRRSLASGLVPPVLTNHLGVTLGGTHSTGGIGISSFRFGSQADNCRALEVVTGAGEIVRCSAAEEEHLFHHVLGGLGQFGVLTKVKVALRTPKRWVRTDAFIYDDVGGFIEDLRPMVESGHIDYVDAFAVRRPSSSTWLFVMRVSCEVDDPASISHHDTPHARRHLEAGSTSIDDFVLRSDGGQHKAWDETVARPWIDALLPWREVVALVSATVQETPHDLACSYALRPFRPRPAVTPMIAIPEGETCLGFGIFPHVRVGGPAGELEWVDHVRRRLTAGGGRRYLSGWNGSDGLDRRSHHGSSWAAFQDAKHLYDPHGVLSPGVGGPGKQEQNGVAGERPAGEGGREPQQYGRRTAER
jgi:cytokinin dehydrogenase